MGKQLIATGQATVIAQKDSYTINQSVSEYVFTAQSNGTVSAAVSFSSILKVTLGDLNITDFTIGAITKPSGFSAITVNNTNKTITYSIAAGTTTLADSGLIAIPVIIGGVSYQVSFSWSKAKAGATGPAGNPGADANMLDWVQDWNSNKTIIGSNSVITPKIFAGTKNANGTITGTAIGRFSLGTLDASGSVRTETIDGVYGFKDGNRTFALDNTGNVQLGRGNQYIKYNAVTGRVEFGSDVSLAWIGATFIDRNGIFTGTLSAGTVNALQLNASLIVAGTINAARIDVASLKASLITTGNIEALTLNVVRGKIGGWSIDTDSIYRGTKNNASGAYTAASGAVCIGSNGIRGFKWRLDATGAGAVAGGNISWDVAGNVTFGASVVLNWTTPINNITTALGGTSFPKLTKISSTGIYTGTLTAAQVNAVAINAGSITVGTLSADRIATGSITSAKLDAASIKANIINTAYINGLSCTFIRGTIGGWTINSTQIYKNSVYLGSDGSISNGTKWKFNNDGSGQVANGNISWNAAGTVTFGASVSLQWKNDIETAKTANYGYRYYKRIVVNGSSGTYYPVVFKGGDQTIKRDILIRRSYSEQAPTDWDNNSTTHKGGLSLLLKVNFGGWGGASYSWDIYELSEVYSRMFAGAAYCGNYCMFAVYLRGGGDTGAVYHVYSDQPIESTMYSPSPIPPAPQIAYNSDRIFQSGITTANAPAPRTLTAAVEEEIRRYRFIGLAQGNDTTLKAHPLTYIGSTGIYTGTLTANQVNAVAINAGSITAGTLSADRIAVGSLNGNKVTARTITADRIVAGSITAGELNVSSVQASVVTAGAVNALTCSFVRGTIGGWTINSTQIYKNSVYLTADGSIVNSTKWKLNNDGSGQIANGAITWNATGAVTFSSTVSLNWTNAATNALNSAKSYADTKKSEAISSASTDATNKANAAKELASAMAFGRMLYRDPTFWNGNNSINLYNNSNNGTVTITRITDSNAPNDSKYVILIKNTGSSSPLCGGFNFGTNTSYRKIFITRIIAKIPSGRNITYHSNAIGNGGSQKWLTPVAGTGDWREYICKVTCGTATFSSTHFFTIDGSAGTASNPVQWWLAYATVFDVTSTEKYTTTIDANGIYTSTLNANQITAGTISADRIATGSLHGNKITARTITASNIATGTITATEINVGSIQASVVTAAKINGLVCNFTQGKIGGFEIMEKKILARETDNGSGVAHYIEIHNTGYICNARNSDNKDFWALHRNGSAEFGLGKIFFGANGDGWLANKNITWDVNGNVSMTGTISATAGKIGNFNISGGKLVNSTTTASIEFTGLSGSSLYLNTTSSLISIRSDVNKTGISIQTYSSGARGIYIVANAGSTYSIEAYGPMQLGQRTGERWCVPGVLYVGCKYSAGYNNYYRKVWGDGMTVSSFSHIGDGKYRVYHNLAHTDYTVMAILWSSTGYYGYFRLLERTSSYFVIQNIGSSGKPDQAPFDFVVMGRNRW